MVAMVPWCETRELSQEERRLVRRRAVFEFLKWDQQVGDVATLAGFPILLKVSEWTRLAAWSERLTSEVLAAEKELVARPSLHAKLGLSWALRRALRSAATEGAARGTGRIMRFDFHFSTEGWRISEANTDVPGGINESSGYPALFAEHFPGWSGAGDPAVIYAHVLSSAVKTGARVALVHATAYTDDRQVMAYVARCLEARGCQAVLASPENVAWREGCAMLHGPQGEIPVDLIVRFFPAEWLPNLGYGSGWRNYFAGSHTPMSNPATAVLTQSKRFPLVWDELETPLPTWRELLPVCAEPRTVDWRSDAAWIVKPALGRVGDGVGIRECLEAREWKHVRRAATRWPGYWIAQRRFDAVPMQVGSGSWYPCIGVYTIDGRVAGAYGRVAHRPLIDHSARDAAVFVREDTR